MKEKLFEEEAFGNQEVWCPYCSSAQRFHEYFDRPGGYLKKRQCQGCGWSTHYPGGVSLFDRIAYKEKCTCGKEHILLTQPDNRPEYRSDVGLVCGCGHIVCFSLPVN